MQSLQGLKNVLDRIMTYVLTDQPIKVFEIIGFSNEHIKLEITEVFGFPDATSLSGGYDVKCNLEICSGLYRIFTDCYYSCTGALYNFYNDLLKCYNNLKGTAQYKHNYSENDFDLNIEFTGSGGVTISGKYQDDPVVKNILYFEFDSDQSYFKDVLRDLKKIVLQFGDNQGVKR
ncbi:MAG: hypothetical protein NC184_03860 [Roseburia sp.]|nr:hypothetical protein [Roseburia sp.]